MKKEAIFIDLKDKNGDEIYQLIDKFRFEKGLTWKQLLLTSTALFMISEGTDAREIFNYLEKKK